MTGLRAGGMDSKKEEASLDKVTDFVDREVDVGQTDTALSSLGPASSDKPASM